jgi:acetyl esterase/lipase
VVTASYRATRDDVVYPVPVQDVACAASWTMEKAVGQGYTPSSLVVVGHSAGAHLAALATLAPGEFAGDCPATPVAPTGLVGLAGPYDLAAVERLAESFVGVPRSQAAEVWSSADPMHRAAGRPEVDVLLLHGDADRAVSSAVSREFAVALRDGGHDVTFEVLPGVDHLGLVVAAEVAGPVIARWVGEHSSWSGLCAPGSRALHAAHLRRRPIVDQHGIGTAARPSHDRVPAGRRDGVAARTEVPPPHDCRSVPALRPRGERPGSRGRGSGPAPINHRPGVPA